MAVKIDNETIDDLLPAKVLALQTICAQALPQNLFLGCHVTAELFGSLDFCRVNFLPDDDIAGRHIETSLIPWPLLSPSRKEKGNF